MLRAAAFKVSEAKRKRLEKHRVQKRRAFLFGMCMKISGKMHIVRITKHGRTDIRMNVYDAKRSYSQNIIMPEEEFREMEEQGMGRYRRYHHMITSLEYVSRSTIASDKLHSNSTKVPLHVFSTMIAGLLLDKCG